MAGRWLPRWLFAWLRRWFPRQLGLQRRPVVRRVIPTLTMLEERWSPTSINAAPPFELVRPRFTQLDSDRAASVRETRQTEDWAEPMPSENIALISTPAAARDEETVAVRTTPQFQQPAATSVPEHTDTSVPDTLSTPLSSQRFSPLSKPPAPLVSPANAAGGGGGRSGSSTPNAGMGGGGPTGGGGGHGVVNANQFVGVNFGAASNALTPAASQAATSAAAATPANGPAASSPLTAFQTSYAMTVPLQNGLHYSPTPLMQTASHGQGKRPSSDPLYVLDLNTGETVPANATLNTFSTWSEDLLAQVSGGAVASVSWNTSQAPDLTNISGQNTLNLQGTWANFTGTAHTDTISVTETPQVGQAITQTMTFEVAGTDSPAYSSTRPTSSSTWPTVITPDQVNSGQATQAAGSYASIGEADGSVQTAFSMPSYNPNTTPVSLDYSSTAANAQPIFLAEYQLPFGQSMPSTITAQLTFDNTALATVTYNTSGLNPGDIVQIALQANATNLSTGRYPWSITVTNGSTPTTYSGSVDIVNEANSPYGAGWSLDNAEQLVSVSGGEMLVNPDGTSLYFASNGQGGFTTPAGDFSTLTYSNGVYTRTMPDGTKINFNSSGLQTSIVDRDGNTTTFNYNSANLLTSITDMNGQQTTLAYNASNQLTSTTDPANRTASLSYSGKQLTSITDPASDVWKYGYDSANDLTTLTDPNSHTTTFAYNSADRVSSVTQPDSTTEQLTAVQMNGWAAAGSSNITATLLAAGDEALFTDGNSNVWSTGLDWLGFGLDTADIDPLGDAALTYLDKNGLAWLSADALGRRTRDFFDNNGNVTEKVADDDSTQQYQYNTFSELTQYTDQDGTITQFAYNGKGDLTQVTDVLNNISTFAYNSAGLVTSTTDPNGNTTTYAYNGLNELTRANASQLLTIT